MSRTLLFFVTLFTLSTALAHNHHSTQLEPAPKPMLGESIYNLDSSWTTQDAKVIKISNFRGHIVVMAMIYTTCKDACPLIVSDVQKIERSLSKETLQNTRFVLVSFDPQIDTPTALRMYAKAHGLDPVRWTLLNGSADSIRDLSAILDVRYRKIAKSDFTHSNIITVLDSEGVVKHQQVGLNQDSKDSIDAIESLAKKFWHNS